MRRNRWTSFPGHCCGGSAARARTRSDAVGFRKGHRRSGAFRPDQFPSRKIADVGLPSPFSPAIFGFTRRLLKACRFAGLSIASSIRTSFWAWAGSLPPRRCWRGDARHSHVYSRIERRSREKRTVGPRGWCAVMLGFKECAPFFPKTRTEVTGTPIRTELVRLDRAGFAAETRIARGSAHTAGDGRQPGRERNQSGANQSAAVFARCAAPGDPLSGARDERLVADNYRGKMFLLTSARFIIRWRKCTAPRILSFARAGAASLAEFAAFSLPGILIPFPYAADDHQTRNAEIFARADAAFF
jgi:UDP-N-acetylglucosamine--N-acetylmuramyl-(pentapeptide) pyrophosphoryl-undecaprenol N-acetylglucosamine transferase